MSLRDRRVALAAVVATVSTLWNGNVTQSGRAPAGPR